MNDLFNIALNSFEKGQLEKSKEICLKILEKNPKDFDTLHLLGILNFFNQGGNIPDIECVVGDVNNDGSIDVTDIIRTVNIIVNSGFPATDEEICAADINGDSIINILDIVTMANIILGG